MKEQFVTYEIALKLKELGFNESCLGYYEFGDIDKEWHIRTKYISKDEYNDIKFIIKAPLWQQAIDFIWEKYYILINAYQIPEGDVIWQVLYEFYPTKEQAILKAIELCKK